MPFGLQIHLATKSALYYYISYSIVLIVLVYNLTKNQRADLNNIANLRNNKNKSDMKKLYFIFILPLFLWGCQSSQGVGSTSPKENQVSNRSGVAVLENPQQAQTLEDLLRRLPGVMVSGSGDGARVKVRGISSSFNQTSSPLFVYDDIILGHDFGSVNRSISVNDVKNIRVLKTSSETSLYGSRGANGVILIKSKDGKR